MKYLLCVLLLVGCPGPGNQIEQAIKKIEKAVTPDKGKAVKPLKNTPRKLVKTVADGTSGNAGRTVVEAEGSPAGEVGGGTPEFKEELTPPGWVDGGSTLEADGSDGSTPDNPEPVRQTVNKPAKSVVIKPSEPIIKKEIVEDNTPEEDDEAPEPEEITQKEIPAHTFTFTNANQEIVFTENTHTSVIVETNVPEGDTREIEYTSSDELIATVDDAGVVTFLKTGTVTIIATKTAKGDHHQATASYELSITKFKPLTRQLLVREIRRAIAEHGDTANLNYIDTSLITNMRYLFSDSMGGFHDFNGDISEWDVSAVTQMQYMFKGNSVFNGDISNWNVSAVTNMKYMFYGATSFNQNISKWDVSQVTEMSYMFYEASSFTGILDDWKVNKKITSYSKIYHRGFRSDLTSKYHYRLNMFSKCPIAQALPSWW